jgi:cation:H+ antiporter
MLLLWTQFGLCAALVLYSGSRLAYFGDVLAEKTGMGRTWVGVVLMASATSLPELITGASAVTVADVPDIAVGNVLGACMINLTFIAVLDLLYRPGAVLSRAEQGHILVAGFGVVMLGIAAVGLLMSGMGVPLRFSWIGLYSPLLLVFYVIGMRVIFRFEQRKIREEMKAVREYEEISSARAYRGFALNALAIIAAAAWLPFVGEDLAEATGWGQTFVGTLLIAMATTLPEVVTSLAALRMGAIDLAIGGLLGSNLSNLAILAVNDLLYTPGPILAHVSRTHFLPALSAIIMSGIAILALFYQPESKRGLRLSWVAAAIFAIYFLNTYGVFVLEAQ